MQLSRRHMLGALGSSLIVPAVSAPPASGATEASFAKLADRWLDGAMRLSPVYATQTGDHRFDGLLEDASAEGRAAVLRFSKDTLRELEALDKNALRPAARVDASLLANELKSQIWNAETLQDWAWNPLNYQAVAGGAVYTLMAREFAPLEQRLASAAERMERIPRFFEQTRAALVPARVPQPHAQTYAQQNKGLKSIVVEMIDPHRKKLPEAARARLDAAIAVYNRAVDEHQAWIETTLLPAAKGDFRAGAAAFDTRLAFSLQSDLGRAEIRRRAEAAVLDIRKSMYELAREALKGRPDAPSTPGNPSPDEQQAAIRAALDLAAAERPPRHGLVEASTAATEEARRFVAKHDLITLPEGPVRIILMPEFQRGFSVAYCDSPGPLDKNLATFYAVSPVPDDWTEEQAQSFLREYNSRGILDIAVHEAMPGHYVQLFHSNSYPSVLRAVLSSGAFIEGWAVYAEGMMVDAGFRADDPLYRLTRLKILLRTVTNAILDQAIHCEGMTEAEAMKFLTGTAFQEEREAAGKWRRAQLSFTQLSTYFVGYEEHLETLAEARRRAGKAFSLKAYHDKVLSFGSPPMRHVRSLMFSGAAG